MVKLKAGDNLAPIRDQLMDLVEPQAKIIEFGCGKGDLLLRLSPKIKTGLGIDKSRDAIERAKRKMLENNRQNIDFQCKHLEHDCVFSEYYDVSIASLFFHVIQPSTAVYLLKKMGEISDSILLCGFSRPSTAKQKFLMWLDQRFSDHYGNFKAYRKDGYMAGLLERTGYLNVVHYDTHIPFVKIYQVN